MKVCVRWHDAYLEEFEAQEVRFGSDLLWMRLENGKNRHIPLRSVRWFSTEEELPTAIEKDPHCKECIYNRCKITADDV